MATITVGADYQLWQLEHRLVTDLLTRVEQSERAILTELRCPTDAVDIFAILNGERRQPWPKKTSARDQQRALHAMYTLAFVDQARRHLHLGHENAQGAAYAALLAGIYAGDAALNAMRTSRARQSAKEKGHKGGSARAKDARKKEADIARYTTEWNKNEELREEYSSLTAFVRERTGWSLKTIGRRMMTPGQ